MPKRSTIPEKIISILAENPAVSREEISKRLGVSYQSVQKHIFAMQKRKVVVPSFSVVESKIKKYIFWVFILTKYTPENENVQNDSFGNDYQRRLCKEIAESFQQNSNFVEGLIFGGADIVIGGTYDIILRLFSDNPDSVGKYVTRFLRPHPAIVSTSTAWSLTHTTMDSV